MKKFVVAAVVAMFGVVSTAEAFGGRRVRTCQPSTCLQVTTCQPQCCNQPVANFLGNVVRFPFVVADRVLPPYNHCNGNTCVPNTVPSNTPSGVGSVPATKGSLPPKVIEAPNTKR